LRTSEGIHYELILLFERFKFKPADVFKKLQKDGYDRSTIYRYYHRWIDGDLKLKTLMKELVQ